MEVILHHGFLVGITLVLFLGTVAQWISWRLKIPSILLLFIFGFLAGPVFGVVDPDYLFGDLLFPLVSFSVAVILFEGGLTLSLKELKEVGKIVRNLITVGILVTWILTTLTSYYILQFNFSLSLLFGAILVVTGPTVIIPLLREVRPKGQLNTILKWEGIMNDPVGALLAVLVFESILASGLSEATASTIDGVLKTVVLGSLLGILGGFIIVFMLRYRLIPDYLLNPISLMMVFCVFAGSNLIQPESGLFAVTIMGIYLANQKKVIVKHIIEFKENLRVLLISVLFIILAAELTFTELNLLGWESLIFFIVLILIVRPLAVFISTIRTSLSIREKIFLSWMAPRGIVAAAVTSLFAFELGNIGIAGSEKLVPTMFMVIVGTIAFYGLSAIPLAKWLKIANPNPQGVLILGAHACGRTIGKILMENGFQVLMVDTNWDNLKAARMQGLPNYYGSIVSEYILDDIDLDGIGRLFALTPNSEVNSLASLYFAKVFGSAEVYQLAIEKPEKDQGTAVSKELRGHILFGNNFTYDFLTEKFSKSAVVKSTPITEEFDFEDFLAEYGEGNVIPLFLVRPNKSLAIFTDVNRPNPQPDDFLISLLTQPSK
jgi:NhaP-type Na+/H+ or K+/H+ antiporter